MGSKQPTPPPEESDAGGVVTPPPLRTTSAHERMLAWFRYDHLPGHLASVSKPFHHLATTLTDSIPPGPERTVALRKLLEAKDAAVRAAVVPGG